MSEGFRAQVVSIDAWREADGGWSWNDMYHQCDIEREEFVKLNTNRKILKWFRDNDLTTELSKGKLTVQTIHGDPEHIEIVNKNTLEPLFAIIVNYD